MTKRPSIISAFSAVSASEQTPSPPAVRQEAAARAPARVGAGVIGVTQRTLSDIRQERDELREKLAKAGGAGDLDPQLIDPSPFPDRLAEANDADFESLKRLVEEEGQKVPIQVRMHPKAAGRFQVIFGHRRWRAARELGRTVKAEIVAATDEELVVAQGIENSARQDLSWIERAQFAWRLEEAEIKPRHIKAALSVDDAELARFRAVCRTLPADVIERIGRAPRIGRPRWAELAKLVTERGTLQAVRKTLSADKVSHLPSDERFRAALAVMTEPKAQAEFTPLRLPDGRALGKFTAGRGDVRIAMEKEHAAKFAAFLEREMPDLIEKFFAEGRDPAMT